MDSIGSDGAGRAVSAGSAIGESRSGAIAAPTASIRNFLTLIKESRPPVALTVVALGLSVLSTAASLVVPLFTKGLIDGFSMSSLSATKIILLALAFIAQAATGAVSAYLLTISGQRVVATLRDRLWKKLLHLKVTAYDERSSGELISRMTNDTAALRTLITENLSGFVGGIVSVVGSVFLLLYLDPHMTLLMLAVIPLAMGVLFPIGRTLRRIAVRTMDENAAFTSSLGRSLAEIRLVKASNAEEREYERGNRSIRALYDLGVREGRAFALVSPIMSLVMMALLVVVIGYGGARVASGALTAGSLVAFLLYLVQTIFPVAQITTFVTQLQKARGATESLRELLTVEEERFEVGLHPGTEKSAVRFDGVDFAYHTGEPVLHDVNIDFAEGQVTALVGPSGGGKTTILSLLERFYEPTAGSITYGGRDIRDYSLAAWRSMIGYVSQDSPLMALSIRNNILYGVDRTVDDEELERAAAAAYADEFISTLPRGWDTEVGERGIQLSGGQRQRIAIARAILRDPDILMLDEATSSLDSASEHFVQRALENLMRGRTTIVVAHRLATVVGADKIVVLEGGRVTGSGRHGELLASHELYRSFAERQLVAGV